MELATKSDPTPEPPDADSPADKGFSTSATSAGSAGSAGSANSAGSAAAKGVGSDVYKSVSKAAVASVVLAIFGAGTFVTPVFAPILLLGAVVGLVGAANVRRFPNELTGRMTGLLGAVVCLLLLIGSVSMHAYIYATEVPEGHQRISFAMLQPEGKSGPVAPPPSALELDGKRIFLTGYVHPDAGMGKITKFVLVPDFDTCCFGGQPKLTDMVEVTLTNGQQITYSMRKRKLAGVLRVNPYLKPREKLTGVYYQLEANYIR